jgi:hypothetical protein
MTEDSSRQSVGRWHSRWSTWLASGALVLAACGDDVTDADAPPEDVAAIEPAANGEVQPAPVLDPVTLSLDAPWTEEVEVERVGDASSQTYAGAIDDDLFVAVVVTPAGGGEPELVGYICDGSRTARWFHTAGASDPSAGAPADLIISLDGQGLSGSLLLDGEELAFEASLAEGEAGLFRADVEQPLEAEDALGDPVLASTAVGMQARGYTGGWIILNAQEQRGAVAFGVTPGVIAVS